MDFRYDTVATTEVLLEHKLTALANAPAITGTGTRGP